MPGETDLPSEHMGKTLSESPSSTHNIQLELPPRNRNPGNTSRNIPQLDESHSSHGQETVISTALDPENSTSPIAVQGKTPVITIADPVTVRNHIFQILMSHIVGNSKE